MESRIQVKLLETDEGKIPFLEWYASLRDKVTKLRIRGRLDRLELGNFGDTQSVGDGVYELRLHFGSGYRVYFTRVEDYLVILIGGGGKNSQQRDITKAQEIWKRYKNETDRYARDFRQ